LRLGKNEELLPRDGDVVSLLKHETLIITTEKNGQDGVWYFGLIDEKIFKTNLPIFLNHFYKSGQSGSLGLKNKITSSTYWRKKINGQK
jgi:hypothetical protein